MLLLWGNTLKSVQQSRTVSIPFFLQFPSFDQHLDAISHEWKPFSLLNWGNSDNIYVKLYIKERLPIRSSFERNPRNYPRNPWIIGFFFPLKCVQMEWLLAVLSGWTLEREKKQKDNSSAEIQTSLFTACPTHCLEFGIHKSCHAENWYNEGFGKHFLCVWQKPCSRHLEERLGIIYGSVLAVFLGVLELVVPFKW